MSREIGKEVVWKGDDTVEVTHKYFDEKGCFTTDKIVFNYASADDRELLQDLVRHFCKREERPIREYQKTYVSFQRDD